ncbi:FKBP-type peptidyl-prolyl cis-trans isomerase [Reinekea blandensis]|uniref:Peptidyl-prolyl cis-trans isomerase n=1 Tax=Reinekea blandensis MED297 TaxID=314283 RepID=A4BD99_9GAMM|nr:FKBP-type peptidyl-prolyl cis-trans isomerase [Reinekea blandensis]EAR09843.1 Peptidylprolyl isomerase, FKBP-type [Reinekea sp. MED297] [Reinekea blandensis MED297]
MSKYDTPELRVSYGIGRQMGGQLLEQPFEGLDIDAVTEGVLDAFNQVADPIAPIDMQRAYDVIREQMAKAQAEKEKELAAEGQAFLDENAKRDNVTVTASGLQYEVLSSGDASGQKPAVNSKVKVHYHGTLVSGDVFDSSVQRGEPIEFAVNGVIPGWTEALQLMVPGDKWKLYVPHNLAYGAQGAGNVIGPYQALIFDVELLDIV